MLSYRMTLYNNRFPVKEHCDLFVRDYVRSELESGHEGPIYLEPLSMNRFTTALISMLLRMNA